MALVMAFSCVGIPVFLFGLPQAIAVAVEAQPRIIRRHTGEEAESASIVQLASTGEMLRIHLDEADVRAPPHNTAAGIPADPGDANGHYCLSDFILGVEKENGCRQDNHTNVASREMCLDAARKAGLISDVAQTDAITDISNDDHDKRPKGCFMSNCQGTTGTCYFWNDAPFMPNNIQKGTPVCRRAYYAWGVATAHDTNNGCPPQYTPVINEQECDVAYTCNTMMPGSPYRVGETAMSDQRMYPLGCFYLRSGTEAYQDDAHFNPLDGPDGTLKDDGPNPGVTGTPICKVSHVLTFDD